MPDTVAYLLGHLHNVAHSVIGDIVIGSLITLFTLHYRSDSGIYRLLLVV